MNNESRRVMLQAGNKLIFHCDDMGATCSITTRLLEAWNNCLIDGFSVFANTQFGDIIQKTLQSSPEKYARISVHLNLWEGKPLSPAEKVPLLVNKDGFFKIEFFNILRYYLFSS